MTRQVKMGIVATFGSIALFFASFMYVQALTISPARIEISGDPGQVLKGEYVLVNEQNEPKTFYPSFENFEAQGETGSPNFVMSNYGLATWIRSEKKITLQPRETRKLQYTISIPTKAEPGGHFAAIFWGTTDPNASESDKQVTIGAKIGVVILLRVNGDVEEGGGVVDFRVVGDEQQVDGETKRPVKRFYSSVPVDFEYRFYNSGADRLKPEGTITVSNLLTLGISKSVLDANHQEGNILPQSYRRFYPYWNGTRVSDVDNNDRVDPRIDKSDVAGFFKTIGYQVTHFTFGVYKAQLDVRYGSKEILSDSNSYIFVVIPWQLLLIVACLLFVLLRLLKVYNKMIIKKAQGQVKKNEEDQEIAEEVKEDDSGTPHEQHG